jgi:L-threonylcarbamoyladenylate synthase
LVLPKTSSIPQNVTAGLNTLAIRVPKHPLALELLRAFAGPLAAPSANRSTHVSPTTAQHVRDEFANSPEPSLTLDGGSCDVGIESTVLDLTSSPPVVLRPGRISLADLQATIGLVQMRDAPIVADSPAKSPGQQERHYAPHTPAYCFETSQRGLINPDAPDGGKNGIVILSPLVVFKKWERIIAMPNDPQWYARELYGVLRELDGMDLAAIYVELPPDLPQWTAIRDRIVRATKPVADAG